MMENEPGTQQDDGRIDAAFRNGSITAVGILTGFSLGFVSQWVSNPIPWDLYDILAISPLIIGIILQVKALAALLSVSSLNIRHYNSAKNTFLAGLLLAAIGITIALGLDVTGVGDVAPQR
jgi:hypothetical protein